MSSPPHSQTERQHNVAGFHRKPHDPSGRRGNLCHRRTRSLAQQERGKVPRPSVLHHRRGARVQLDRFAHRRSDRCSWLHHLSGDAPPWPSTQATASVPALRSPRPQHRPLRMAWLPIGGWIAETSRLAPPALGRTTFDYSIHQK